MALESTCGLGPTVTAAIGEVELDALLHDDGVALLRPRGDDRELLVVHGPGPDPARLIGEAERLWWLDGRGPAPQVVASGRADDAAETLVVAISDGATPGSLGHPLGPEATADALAGALRALHDVDGADCPFDASSGALRARTAHPPAFVVADGPYAGWSAAELLRIHEDLDDGNDAGAVPIHGGLRADRVWFAPDGSVTFLGWHAGGLGDHHVDLAAAAAIVTELHGPALVAPMLAAYGLDRVDVRRLDAAQLLVQLLR